MITEENISHEPMLNKGHQLTWLLSFPKELASLDSLLDNSEVSEMLNGSLCLLAETTTEILCFVDDENRETAYGVLENFIE